MSAAEVLLAALAGACWLLAQHLEPPVPAWPTDDRPPAQLNGNYVYWDSARWQAVVVFPSEAQGATAAPPKIARVPFHNRFDPRVREKTNIQGKTFLYEYSAQNGAGAIDSVASWALVTPCGDPSFKISKQDGHSWQARIPAAPQVELPHLKELDCYATTFAEPAQTPGSPPAKFSVASAYKPGLTTASASHYPPFEVPADWPEPVMIQLTKLGDPRWADAHVPTIGPRFPPETSTASIAADFRDGIADLVRRGSIEAGSPFAIEAIATFSEIAETGDVRAFSIRSRPSEGLESEILNAAMISFDIAKRTP